MQFSAIQIAQLINGDVENEQNVTVSSFGKIEEAKAGQIAFLANPKYEEFIYTTNASIVIINKSFVPKQLLKPTLIKVEDAYSAFATLLAFYQNIQEQDQFMGIEQPSFIDATAIVGEKVYIGAFAYLGKHVKVGEGSKIFPQVFLGDNVSIGNNVTLHSGVKIYHNCVIGNNVIIHAGTVIGSDGFGFAPQPDGSYKKVPQIGNVIVEDDVEIGGNGVIDRATIGSTIIKKYAKLDNLVQIAHNVEVGNNTVIAAQVGISGSTKIGNNVMIGGQAGLAGHIYIADGTKINGQSGISKSTKENSSLTGSPAGDFTQMLRGQSFIKRLPELEKRITTIEKVINQKEA
jgi:UDP-3-O-[3-hydroxymyristoyl] glucosamine N-acyltransferase